MSSSFLIIYLCIYLSFYPPMFPSFCLTNQLSSYLRNISLNFVVICFAVYSLIYAFSIDIATKISPCANDPKTSFCEKTRRERPKSVLYIRLIEALRKQFSRQRFVIQKNLTMPKIVKGGPFGFFQHPLSCKKSKK